MSVGIDHFWVYRRLQARCELLGRQQPDLRCWAGFDPLELVLNLEGVKTLRCHVRVSHEQLRWSEDRLTEWLDAKTAEAVE
ncbi:MAG: hypothetical protein K0S42_3064, partial [Microvirga sp.]|nr:hypothetical protein [Microvirga sp.]